MNCPVIGVVLDLENRRPIDKSRYKNPQIWAINWNNPQYHGEKAKSKNNWNSLFWVNQSSTKQPINIPTSKRQWKMSTTAHQPSIAPMSKFLSHGSKQAGARITKQLPSNIDWMQLTRNPKKVECKNYILTGKEERELYILWKKEIETKIKLHFSTEEAQMKVVGKVEIWTRQCCLWQIKSNRSVQESQ